MKHFRRTLDQRNNDPTNRRWIFIPYDQLTDQIGPLSREDQSELGIIIIESPWKAGQRPYHQQKLALIIANLRHFALEQAERGIAVKHIVANGPYHIALQSLAKAHGPIRVMEPAERELRVDLAPLVLKGSLEVIPHEGWLTTSNEFEESCGTKPPWRMDSFYRSIRRTHNILMQSGKPIGGKFSLDVENRRPWKGKPKPPESPRFKPDHVTKEVGELIETKFSQHPGELNLERLPATLKDAEYVWSWAKRECMEHFGPFEDAMTVSSTGLFHTRISALLNIHRLLPRSVIDDVLDLTIPLASKEGFIRQVLGWREFVHHVHDATDGFRRIAGRKPAVANGPGDGGWSPWRGEKWRSADREAQAPGGAKPNHLQARRNVPPAYWGEESGLFCLDEVVRSVWEEGYSHHIIRLMILSNIATLLDIAPRDLTDWFWVAYQDAFDWVVEPNVLGMGTFAVGDIMTTKPYISGAAYINRMSDFCSRCQFDPKKNCPITNLYWAFLNRKRSALEPLNRLRPVIRGLDKRGKQRLREDERVFRAVSRLLKAAQRLDPANLLPSDSVRKKS